MILLLIYYLICHHIGHYIGGSRENPDMLIYLTYSDSSMECEKVKLWPLLCADGFV